MIRYLATLLLSLSLVHCGGEDPNTTPGPDVDGGAHASHANEVNAQIEGAGATAVTGQSETTVPQQFAATVAGGELTVYLVSSSGTLIFFRLDMTKTPLPGRVTAGEALDSPAYLNVTSPGGIFESKGAGQIVVDQCPDAKGKEITGSFDNVALTSPLGGESKLSGSFKVTLMLHDGSHHCGETPTKPTEGPPGCSVAACDGPCCPYQACMASCMTGCMQTSCMGLDVMACFSCLTGCPDKCGVSQQCRSCLQTLDGCAQKFSCEPAPPEDSPCVGQNCCSEYKACF